MNRWGAVPTRNHATLVSLAVHIEDVTAVRQPIEQGDGHQTDSMASNATSRTYDLRVMSAGLAFVSDCWEMVYGCQIKTYDAGRRAAEGQPKARRAALLQLSLQFSGSDYSSFTFDRFLEVVGARERVGYSACET